MSGPEVLADAGLDDVGFHHPKVSRVQFSIPTPPEPDPLDGSQESGHPTTNTPRNNCAMTSTQEQLLALERHVSEARKVFDNVLREAERLRTSIQSAEKIRQHSSVVMRENLNLLGPKSLNIEQVTTIIQRHEALRANLISSGVWYDNVDALIDYCDNPDGADPILKPIDRYPLGLHKATCLEPGLGVREDDESDDVGHHEGSTSGDAVFISSDSLAIPEQPPPSITSGDSSSPSTFATPALSINTPDSPLLTSRDISLEGEQEKAKGIEDAVRKYRMVSNGEVPDHITEEVAFPYTQQPGFAEFADGVDLHTSRKQMVDMAQTIQGKRIPTVRKSDRLKSSESAAPEIVDTSLSRDSQRESTSTPLLKSLSAETTMEDLPSTITQPEKLFRELMVTAGVTQHSFQSSSPSSTRSIIVPQKPLERPVGSNGMPEPVSTPQISSRKRTKVRLTSVRWTEEEEEEVLAIVRELKKKQDIKKSGFWEGVSKALPERGYERTPSSIFQRWSNRLSAIYQRREAVLADSDISRTSGKSRRRKSSTIGPSVNEDQDRPRLRLKTRLTMEDPSSGETEDEPHRVSHEKPIRIVSLSPSGGARRSRLNLFSKSLPTSLALFNNRQGCHLSKQLRSTSILSYLKSQSDDWLRLTDTWTGASHDMNEVAWAPDGTRYVAGSSTLTDEQNIEYNRPNNLVFGNRVLNTLRELPDHHVENSAPSLTSNPKIYETISALHWSSDGRYLYSASYDKTVKMWNLEDYLAPKCVLTLQHDSEVVVMSVAQDNFDLVVTGTNSGLRSLRAFTTSSDGVYRGDAIPLRETHRGKSAFVDNPNCVRLGSTNASREYLAAGFGSPDINPDGSGSNLGLLGLWRAGAGRFARLYVQPREHAVFDIAWSPTAALFATGNAVKGLATKRSKTRTSIRIYPVSELQATIELECPALDINEVGFCPYDERYLTASCTDGVTYVWDCRRPDRLLHQLPHGLPASGWEGEDHYDRELADVGVRFAVWGNDSTQFLTGASDGVVKRWDIRRSPRDVLVSDVADFGVELMCGSFSPDKTNLLVGDASGSLNILSKSPPDEDETITEIEFVPATEKPSSSGGTTFDESVSTTQGRDAAVELIGTRQIIIHPTFGPGKGPAYNGPYSRAARGFKEGKDKVTGIVAPEIKAEILSPMELLPDVQKMQRDQTNYKLKRNIEQAVLPQDADSRKIGPSPSSPRPIKVRKTPLPPMKPPLIDLTDDRNGRGVRMKVQGGKSELPTAAINSHASKIHQDFANNGTEVGDQNASEEDLETDNDDDFWFPPHSTVDANFQKSGA